MKHKNSNILKKTIKISTVTCVALGGAALIASGAAVKALTEGAQYLKNTVRKIIEDGTEVNDVAVAEEELIEDTATAEDCTYQ